MLSPEEERFMHYWDANREKQKKFARQLFFGLPFGLLLGIGIVVLFESGWYERANMVAYTQSTPWVLIAAIIITAVFTGVFYKRYKWEANEQRFKELQVKKRNSEPGAKATN
jgi:hypothetical protein